MNIPFVDLKTQYESIKGEIKTAIDQVLDNTAFVLGESVRNFEKRFAEYCQVKYAVGVNSGTSALHLALLAAGIKAGDEVITVPNTFIATVEAICYTGARPVLVDIDPKSNSINPELIEAAITSKTKAILPVHLYGQPANMDAIMDISRRHDLLVIEDACQAHGAEYRGKRVGSFGRFGCFSFYPGKNLGAYGEGGAVVTNDEKFYNELNVLRDHGSKNKYYHVRLGYNYRISGIQGAVLGVKLSHIHQWTEARRKNAMLYNLALKDAGLDIPEEMPNAKHVYHLYVIRTKNRNMLQQYLKENNVATGLHYPVPIHLQEGYQFLGYGKGSFSVAEKYAEEILSLPMYPELTKEQIEHVVDCIKSFIRKL